MISNISNTNNSIDYQSFVWTRENGFKYFYELQNIQLNTSHLFALS